MIIRFIGFVLLVLSGPLLAQSKFEIEGDECGGDVTPKPLLMKTDVMSDKAHDLRMYGVLKFQRSAADVEAKRCSVTYKLFVAHGIEPYEEVESLDWKTEEGEIGGIRIMGTSPDGSKIAADFWLAEGDSTEHRIFLLGRSGGRRSFRSIEQKIYDLSVNLVKDTENYYETMDSVRDDGLIVVTSHADGGEKPDGAIARWTFSPLTGTVHRMRLGSK